MRKNTLHITVSFLIVVPRLKLKRLKSMCWNSRKKLLFMKFKNME